MATTSRDFAKAQFERLNGLGRVPIKRASIIATMAFDAIDSAPQIAATAEANPHLNDAGKRAARLKALESMFVDIERSKSDLDKIKRETDKALGELALPALDKTDVVGAMLDAEARALVRAMPAEARNRLDRLPPALAKAVIRAAPELSGVSESTHKMLRDQLLEVAHPEKLAALRGEAQAHELATHFVDEAGKALREAANFAPGEDREFMVRVRQAAAQPKVSAEPDPNDLDAMIAERRRRVGMG